MGKLALRCAAGATGLTALTTILLWLLPQLTPDSVPAVEMYTRSEYMARLWINLAHVGLALFGYAAAATVWSRRSVTLAAIGAGALTGWALLEAVGVTINIFAVNGAWRPALSTGNAPDIQAHLAWFSAWWDAVFFLLLVLFLIGTGALGTVSVAGRGLERVVGVMMLLGVPLTVAIILEGYFGLAAVGSVSYAVYPILQPISRGLLGWWLWREAGKCES